MEHKRLHVKRRVTKSGSVFAITFTRKMVEEAGFRLGDKVFVVVRLNGVTIYADFRKLTIVGNLPAVTLSSHLVKVWKLLYEARAEVEVELSVPDTEIIASTVSELLGSSKASHQL